MDDFFETAPLGIHVASADGRVLRVNAAELEMLGYAREEYVGRPLTDFHVDPATIDGLFARLRRGEVVRNLESRARRGDGTVRWLRMSANAVTEGGALVRTHCFSRDVTGAKEAEAALRTSEERYRALVEGAREYAVHGLDPDGRVASWNRGAEQLYGWAEGEVLGRDLSLFFAPEDVTAGMSERMLRLARSEGRFHHEGWRVRKDGSRFWAEVTLTALRDGTGQVQEIAHVTRDASERRRLDALRRKAADLAAENLVVLDAHRRALDLLGAVAGALETPMAAIERAAGRLGAPRPQTPERLAAVAAVEDGVADVRTELGRSLDRARTEAGEAEPAADTVDLLRLAAEARDVLREVAFAREIRVEVEVDAEMSSARVADGQLGLVLYNLLAHAIQCSRDGGFVALRVLPEGAGAFRIEAEDTGPGLSPDDVARLLRGEDGPVCDRPPAGPWISPTKRIVEQRGGRLAVQSVLGRGSVLSVVLPRNPLAQDATGRGASGRAGASRSNPASCSSSPTARRRGRASAGSSAARAGR